MEVPVAASKLQNEPERQSEPHGSPGPGSAMHTASQNASVLQR